MNKAILMGRLVNDLELKYIPVNNTPVCTLKIAVDRKIQKKGEERKADFIPVVVYGKTAEFCKKHLQKGVRIATVGSLQVRSWNDAQGVRRYATEVIAEEVHFADGKRDTPVETSLGGYPIIEEDFPNEPLEEDDLPF